MGSPIQALTELGQSLWYDNIERRLLINGEIAAMIERGDIRGMTSNPAIFNQAISKSKDYDASLIPMAWAGSTPVQIYEQLAIEDIRTAADLFMPIYKQTGGKDGYVSLEVSPTLAADTDGTLADAKRLWKAVDRPNLMIKIPATREGLPAIKDAIAAGINVNVTLIFSVKRYLDVMEAYISGLETRTATGKSVDGIASVASFFISRIDSKVDSMLKASPQGAKLQGKLAVANAKLAYQEFRKVFETERFTRLKAKGARPQRPLWASTSTKNPDYPDTLYVDTLIGAETVNTAPPATLVAFKDHGKARLTLEEGLPEAQKVLAAIAEQGISLDDVTQALEEEGVKSFQAAFTALLGAVKQRAEAAQKQIEPLAAATARKTAQMASDKLPARIQAGDPTLWTQDPKGHEEVRNRLGWLHAPTSKLAQETLASAQKLTQTLLKEGYTHAVVLGMGGSSLAPEVMSLVLPQSVPGLSLSILDSTDPAQVHATVLRSSLRKTVFIVSSKSGSTAEINAFFDYFWARARRSVGSAAGEHFIAITDPNTTLEKMARERGFRQIFISDPSVGGRYSAFTPFGIVPAALMGADAALLLGRAASMQAQCAAHTPPARNPALVLGAVLAEAVTSGRDKLTLIADPRFASFGSWLEQLVAESSGKNGQGIVPINAEPFRSADAYGKDRIFVYLRHDGRYDGRVQRLNRQGHPVLVYALPDPYDLGAEFYRWEYATAVVCAALGVNAFDQPDVQDSKTRTLAKIAAFRQNGALDEGAPVWQKDGYRAYANRVTTTPEASLAEILAALLGLTKEGDYVAINAYLPRNARLNARLQGLRKIVLEKTGCATTLGFGPRFLHSTGQLHKGGKDNGVFLQITSDPFQDYPIPEETMNFATLERAQALGDYEALQARQRRILRIHLPNPGALEELIKALA